MGFEVRIVGISPKDVELGTPLLCKAASRLRALSGFHECVDR